MSWNTLAISKFSHPFLTFFVSHWTMPFPPWFPSLFLLLPFSRSNSFFFFLINLLLFLFLAALGLCCCVRAFSSCGERGYSSQWCAGFLLWWLLLLQSMGSRRLGFSSCGTWAKQLWLMGLVDVRHVGFPQPGIEPVSPALARRFLTTAPPRKSPISRILIPSFSREILLLTWLILIAFFFFLKYVYFLSAFSLHTQAGTLVSQLIDIN